MNIKDLEKLSPYPIKYTNVYGAAGEFVTFIGTYTCQINIDKNKSETIQLAALAHEIGHALCYQKKCKCMKNANKPGHHCGRDSILAEYHAMKFCIQFLLDNKLKEALENEIKEVKETALNNYSVAHTKAAKKIMKLKLWQKALDFVKEN